MPQDQRHLRVGEFSIGNMQVGATDAASMYLKEHLSRGGRGYGYVPETERLARGI
jgi:hypothetical protein